MTDRSINSALDEAQDRLKQIKDRPTKEMLGERSQTCDAHGPFTASGVRYLGKHEIWTPCPDCEEARLAAERQAKALEQAEHARLEMERLLGEACIPKRFMSRSLDNFKAVTDKQTEALHIAREFAENFERHAECGDSLIFGGMPGTGKSHLAISILQAILPKHLGLYTTASGVIRAIRGTWRKDSERSETEVMRIFADADLLVIDEIGVGYETDGERIILFDLLDLRYRNQQPTILLTNLNRAGLKNCLGERLYDRMTETAQWVPFAWESHRKVARDEYGSVSSNDSAFSQGEQA